MITPGFTAEASLYRSLQSYAMRFVGEAGSQTITPSVTCDGGIEPGRCSECLPAYGSSSPSYAKICFDLDCNWHPEPCCPDGTTNCGGTCTDTNSDSNNCGRCGRRCFANFYCDSGICKGYTVWHPGMVPKRHVGFVRG